MSRNTIIAIVVFLLLIAAGWWRFGRKHEQGIARISFAKVDPSTIDQLVFSGRVAAALDKGTDGIWKIKGRDADQQAVKSVLDAIPRIESSDLATNVKERFAELEVDDAKGTRVEAFSNGKLQADFVVGKYSRTGMNVRVEDRVFVIAKMYPMVFTRDASAWMDKKLFRDPLDSVTRLDVHLKDKPAWALVKKANLWELENPKDLPAGFRFDNNSARALVGYVLNASAKEILDTDPGAATTGLDEGADRLVATLGTAGNLTRELKLGASTADAVYGSASTRKDLFTFPAPYAALMRKVPTDFRDLSMMNFDRTKAKALAIEDGAKKVSFKKKDGAWTVENSSDPVTPEFDPESVDRRLAMLAGTRGAELVATAERSGSGLESPSAKIKVTLDDGKTVSLLLGKEIKKNNQDMVYVRGNADGETYLVAKGQAGALTGMLPTFKKPVMPHGMPPSGGGGLSKLSPEMRQQIMEQLSRQRHAAPPPAPQ